MEGAQEYNIWYGKFIGDYSDKMDREPATDRCKIETDAGYTRADQNNSDKKNKRFFCVHFAHGVCAKGHECTYYHRIPLPEDDARTDELFDCFGRQRHSKHKDDMSGVGSFMKPCRTLFVGNLQKTKYDSPQALEDACWRHFGEWGELESCNVVHRLSIAFPRFRLRTSAEFAKEAMTCQALDHGEVLSIRWAHDDPNPVAKDAIQRADRDAMAALLRAKGISITPAGFDYPASYPLPDAKRMRLEDGGSVLAQYPELAYPNTDSQFQQVTEASSVESAANKDQIDSNGDGMSNDLADATAKQNALARLGLLTSTNSNSSSSSGKPTDSQQQEASSKDTDKAAEDGSEEEEDEEDESGWEEFIDENTGAKYFFNTATGESSWTQPADFVAKK